MPPETANFRPCNKHLTFSAVPGLWFKVRITKVDDVTVLIVLLIPSTPVIRSVPQQYTPREKN